MPAEDRRETNQYELVGTVLGVSRLVVHRRFTLYIPDKNRHGQYIDSDTWISRAMQLLTEINGGATALPAARGMWKDDRGNILDERTVIVYSFIKPERFFERLPVIRAFLHRFGRETDQGEVLIEYGSSAMWIDEYDL
jgi:hypothetical protein